MKEFAPDLVAFTRIEAPGRCAYVRTADADWLEKAGVLEPWRLAGPEAGLGRGRATALRLAGSRACFLKQYFRGGLAAWVLADRYFGLRRFVRELAAYERLSRCGVAVPRILALVTASAGLGRRAWLVSDWIEGYHPLRERLAAAAPAERRRLVRRAGAAAGAMHAVGVLHPDLTLDNVQVGPSGDVLLLDFDRCAFTASRRRRWHDLFRLHRSALKGGLWRAGGGCGGAERRDIAAFLLGYRGAARRPSRVVGAWFVAYRLWEGLHALLWSRAHA